MTLFHHFMMKSKTYVSSKILEKNKCYKYFKKRNTNVIHNAACVLLFIFVIYFRGKMLPSCYGRDTTIINRRSIYCMLNL